MRYRFAVTFESDTKPPETFRGEVDSQEASECARISVVRAEKLKRKGQCRSLSILLDRADEPDTPPSHTPDTEDVL